MNKYQHLFLYTAIVSALYNTAWAAEVCDPTNDICTSLEVTNSNKNIGKNIIISQADAAAIHVKDGTSLTGSININGKKIINNQGTAIKIDGGFSNGYLVLKNNATVRGNGIAMDFSQADSAIRLDVENSYIYGDIIGQGKTNNSSKINFALNGSSAYFDGYRILDFKEIFNDGTLTIVGKDRTIIFNTLVTNKTNSTLIFKIGDDVNLDNSILKADSISFKGNNTIKLHYVGTNISNIIDRDIVLIESGTALSKDDIKNINYHLHEDPNNTKFSDYSPLLTQTNSWVEETPALDGSATGGHKVIVNYGIGYGGASNFSALAEQGGASANALLATKFIVPKVLNDFNQSRSAASDQALALLISAGNNASAIANLANQMTPNSDGSELRAANQLVGDMRNHIAQRQLGYLGQLPAQERDSGWNLWVNTLYGHGSQSGNDYANGFNMNRYGISLGADQEIDDSAMLGFALGYSHNQADSRGVDQSKRIDTVELMPYLGWRSGMLFAEGNLNIGYLRVKSERKIDGGNGWQGESQANGDYTGMQAGYQLNAGLNLELAGLHLRPMLTYQYQWVNLNSWHESGSVLALSSSSQKYSLNHLGGGVSAWTQLATGWGTLTPSLQASYLHDLDGERRIRQRHALVSINNAGSTFETIGARVGGNQVRVDANARLDISDSLNLGIGVGYNRDDRYGEGVIGLTLGNRF
ncbi:autotransporter outer membrane beta-barrel domain-containing protein [Edwardsiella hoshinae]|uniref:autotransporter family protein n=1 Tax=Edwardsiella hoshinae TaxID=93378 RepID=UPI0004060C32|nr:autotransporter outer membrane beta-barrel domain-containing protein [Edwardsiella hoshinae]QPR28166.1 autotransporter outer membrane beta-barrel domain-containing protein [Edwardsiella hoshinae]